MAMSKEDRELLAELRAAGLHDEADNLKAALREESCAPHAIVDPMSLLSKIARTRPRPDASLAPAERSAAQDLKKMGYVEWDLGSKGWTPTSKGLEALSRW